MRGWRKREGGREWGNSEWEREKEKERVWQEKGKEKMRNS